VSPAASARAPGAIWLVRHASTEWTGVRWCGRSDPELTASGKAAADRLAAELAVEIASATARTTGPIILASPLRRALETADSIGRALGTRVRVEPDLVEVDFGTVDGLTWAELVTADPDLAGTILAGAGTDWPGGETASDVTRRAQSVADRILGMSGTGPVVVVGHARFLGDIARHLPVAIGAWDGAFAPASARRFDFDADRWVPSARNEVPVG
jgi:probable phosphoglycerate mutase